MIQNIHEDRKGNLGINTWSGLARMINKNINAIVGVHGGRLVY